MKIEGSVALVTGSNRGLGKAIVAALVEAGAAKVYAAARDETQTQRDQIAAAADVARDVTLLINNAGVLTSYGVLTMREADLDADYRTNVLGTLEVIKAFVPVLERARGATIVNVLSLAALASFPALGGYASSKAAAYSITQALRPELRTKQIEILAALPGPIDTDMVRALPMPKASATDVASGVLAGIARGDEDIFPDPMAQQMGALWSRGPKDLERAFAAL